MKKTAKTEMKNALKELKVLKNTLTDLVPQQSYETTQLSNLDTLFINNRYTPLTINRILLAYLYCEHGIIQSAIDQPVQDAIRGGLEITSGELDNDDIDELQRYLEEKNVLGTVAEAEIWKRLFGGSGLIVNMEVDPAQPFIMKQTGELEFYAADRWELASTKRTDEFYNFYGQKIHSSRVITFVGKKAPSFIRPQLQGWGMSEVERMVRDLNSYLKNKNLIFELLDESKIDVYKVKNFNNSLVTAAGTAKIQKRIELANKLKNFERAVILDKEDDYDQKTMTYAGLAEMIKENRIGIASALRMPMTKLFGLSASGFNSGEDDLENYNAMVESEIRNPLRQPLRVVLSLCCMQLFGHVPDFNFGFKPLRIMDGKDEELINTSRQSRLISLYDRGLLYSEQLGKALEQYKLLPIPTDIEQGILPDQPEPPPAPVTIPGDTE